MLPLRCFAAPVEAQSGIGRTAQVQPDVLQQATAFVPRRVLNALGAVAARVNAAVAGSEVIHQIVAQPAKALFQFLVAHVVERAAGSLLQILLQSLALLSPGDDAGEPIVRW